MEKIGNRKSLLIPMLAFCFGILFSFNVQAQNNWVTLPNGKKLTEKNGKLKTLKVNNPKEIVKIIVELRDKPLALYESRNVLRKISLTSVLSTLKLTHSEMVDKIQSIAGRLSAASNFRYTYKIEREYYTAINGMTMQCNRAMIREIRELPDVKGVWLDRKVKATWINSDKQIRADIVQDSLGYTGKGVLIGELDTGIDYKNPLLGGGFGPGYRVIGGYNFVNNDSDVYDNNGHGTHVAGILGANGDSVLIGVAPDVKYLAVKVLDYNGIGLWSNIIAGIEYCMDPDGNPNTDDAVDIINMSLGGTAIPDNPVDQAVDNAAAAGILSVIAAGNNGYDFGNSTTQYETIGSPGTAESALTVGACNDQDWTADFSSKGPDPIHYDIKPEVSAPGVNILSILPNNQTASWSGTSMATPQVAGVAALLKQEHPDWTPGQIKAAIINSAKQTGTSIFEQGNGRVDALKAVNLGIVVEPGVVNFGLVDLTKSVWMDTVEIKVKNIRNVLQNFNLEIKPGWSQTVHGVPIGAELNLSQTSFELAPEEEKEITAIISVPSSVPILNGQPYAYTGDIMCQSDSDIVQVPFSFIKSNILDIECDAEPTTLSLYYGPRDQNEIDILSRVIGEKLTVTIPVGYYSLWACLRRADTTNNRYYDYYIFRDSVEVKGLTSLTLNMSDAKFEAFNGVDQLRDINDNPVTATDSTEINFQIDYLYNRSIFYVGGWKYNNLRVFFSPLDSRFLIHQDMIVYYGNQSILLAKFAQGVQSQDDLTFLSGSKNLGDLYLNLDYSKRKNRGPFVQVNETEVYENNFEGGWDMSLGFSLPNMKHVHLMVNKLTSEFDPMHYLSMSIGLGSYSYNLLYGFGLPDIRTGTTDFYVDSSRDFVFFDRKFFRPDQKEYVRTMTYSSGDTLSMSENADEDVVVPKVQFLYQYFNANDLGLVEFSPDGYDDGGIGWSNGIRYYGSHVLIYQYPAFDAQMYSRNRLLQVNYMPSTEYMFYFDYNVNQNANRYRLLADTRLYNLLGQNGKSTIDYEFNVTDPVNPWKCFMPSLDLFQVLENGKPAKWLHPNQDNKVRLVIFDPKNNVDSVSISLIKNDGSEIVLKTTKASQKEYFAQIPDNIPTGFLDVVARVQNSEGNKFKLTVSPAFYSGSTLDSVYDARLQMIGQTLDNVNSVEFNPGDTLKYTLKFDNYGNITAKDVTFNFPETDYFTPIDNTSVTVDSINFDPNGGSYGYEIPVNLVFRGKKQPDEKLCYYYPTVTWKSGNRTFTRKYKILVDFEGTPTGILASGSDVPTSYALSQNYPNPFNPTTRINYSIPQKNLVTLKVYDILGRDVATLVNEIKPAGNYDVMFKGSRLSSGVYFYRMHAGNFTEVKKLLLIK